MYLIAFASFIEAKFLRKLNTAVLGLCGKSDIQCFPQLWWNTIDYLVFEVYLLCKLIMIKVCKTELSPVNDVEQQL